MTPEQLKEPALVYNPYFDRIHEVKALDSLSNVSSMQSGQQLVLAIDPTPRNDNRT